MCVCVCVCVFIMSEYVGGCGRYIAKSVNCVHVRLVSRVMEFYCECYEFF